MIDTHIHLDVMPEPALAALPRDYQAIVPGITPEAVTRWLGRCPEGVALASGGAWHPWYLPPFEDEPRDALRVLCSRDDVAWVGETGLDHYKHRTDEDRGLATLWFGEHLRLARELDKPVIVHCVRAHGACLEALEGSGTRGIVHAFSGSPETMREYRRRGYCVGIGAAVTRARSKRVRAAAQGAAIDSLVLETDAPFMATGELKRNRGRREGVPMDIRDVYDTVAELRCTDVASLVEAVARNAERLVAKRV